MRFDPDTDTTDTIKSETFAHRGLGEGIFIKGIAKCRNCMYSDALTEIMDRTVIKLASGVHKPGYSGEENICI